MGEKGSSCLIAVRLRGTVGDSPDVEKTLESLMLERTFRARLLNRDESTDGMLRRVRSLVAWGEVESDVLETLLKKRGEREGGPRGVDDEFAKRMLGKETLSDLAKSVVSGEMSLTELWRAGLRPGFRLHAPKGGFRRSTRRAFTDRGELGYRGVDINGLVRRMM